MQTADSIIFYPLSLRALDVVNVCLFAGQEIVNPYGVRYELTTQI